MTAATTLPARVIPLRRDSGTRPGRRERIQPASPQSGLSRAVKLGARERSGNGDLNQALCERCGTWLGPLAGRVVPRIEALPDGTVPGGLAAAVVLCGPAGCSAAAGPAGGWKLPAGTDPRQAPIDLAVAGGATVPAWLSATRPEYLSKPERGTAA